MPELPEVETIRRGLEGQLIGQVLQTVEPADQAAPLGAAVTGLRRFGKLLVIDFAGDISLIFHLKMTGQLVYRATDGTAVAGGHPNSSFVAALPDKTTRAVFVFSGGRLFFNDQRKFGFYQFLPRRAVEELPFVQKLGPEPWVMTPAELAAKLHAHSRSKIKALLLDQTIMAGLGNIYADETLFLAGVHPERLAGSLSQDEVARLITGAQQSMEASLASGGSSLRNYRRTDGSYGDYLTLFANAYGRAGQPCKKCGRPIVKTKVAGRGTHFCPECQQ